MARQALTASVVVGLLVVSLAACSSESSPAQATAASASSTPAPSAAARRQTPRSGIGTAKIDASSLPVPEDFESEFRKQITSSNYLEALGSAAAEASAANRTHP